MAAERTLYWIAVGLMALLLGHHFANKYDRCLADISTAVVDRFSLQAGHSLSRVEVALERVPTIAPDRVAVSPAETLFQSIQAKIRHPQAACARVEAQRARNMAMDEISQIWTICPRQRVRTADAGHHVPSDGTI
jgi:hypothetical protein